MKSIADIKASIVAWFEMNRVESFYSGIRADVAAFIGVAPNNVTFNALLDQCNSTQAGDGCVSVWFE